MKRFISVIFISLVLSFGTTQTASAIFCSNCSTIFTQILEHARAIITSGATMTTAVNTTLVKINDTVLDPMANNMLALVQIQQQLKTINFVTMAFGDGNSLLIQNPEQWIKNKGKSMTTVALGEVANSNGIYNESLLASLVGTYKGATDLRQTIRDVNSSNVPNTIQKNICNESSLNNIAKSDVMRSDGSFSVTEMQARKAELYNSLCVSNPATNAQLAKTLTTINQNIPQIGGWDVWLQTTGGDNAYNKSIQLNLAVSKAVQSKEDAARDDLNRGGGIASLTECTETASFDQSGDPYPTGAASIPCITETIRNTGSAINSAFQEALNAPLKKLQSSFGSGIYKSLSSIMTIISSSKQLSMGFQGAGGGNGNQSNQGSLIAQLQNTNDITTPEQQVQTSDNVRKPLNEHLQSLSTLQSTENSIISEFNAFKGRIGSIKTCYDNLVSTYGAAGDSRITSAYTAINDKEQYISSGIAAATNNINKIGETRDIINAKLSFISTSTSTGAMLKVFTDYQQEIEAKNLPSIQLVKEREAELVTLNANHSYEFSEEGNMTKLNTLCNQIYAEYTRYNGY